MWTLPNLLTLSRIAALPLLAFLLWWPNWQTGYALAFVLYVLMGITDYFDGYLARTSGAVSRLGAFLVGRPTFPPLVPAQVSVIRDRQPAWCLRPGDLGRQLLLVA